MNRIAHARRYDRDRSSGPADWQLAVEQRYLYDASNQRTVKTTTFRGVESGAERTALYVYPGDFERRGLQTTLDRTSYEAISGDTETQYGVGGARVVWRTGTRDDGLDRDQRITIALTDLIQSTTAVIDLATGELVETGSYYANGARETYRSNETETVAPEPMGFTGKEADEEVGLTYFGHRYLMAHLGRWASPDPLQTHAVGGGEALNGYHYVSGNVLQARDPVGLDRTFTQFGPFDDAALGQATFLTVQLMRSQLLDYWGLNTSISVDGTTVNLRPEGPDDAAFQSALQRVVAVAENSFQSYEGPLTRDQYVASQKELWGEGRERLAAWLGPRDVGLPVDVRTRDEGAPLLEGRWDPGPIPPPFGDGGYAINPYTYFLRDSRGEWHYTMEGVAPLAALVVGPTVTLGLHESSHEFDLVLGPRYGCLANAGDNCTSGGEGEEPGGREPNTVLGVDRVLSPMGGPTRERYPIPGTGEVGGGRRHELSDGTVVPLPSDQELTTGRMDHDP